VSVFSLIKTIIWRDPIVMVPYAVYALLTFLITTHFGPDVPASATAKTMSQLPTLMLFGLILGDFLARGVTLMGVSAQFKKPSKQPWIQWWRDYLVLSLGFCGVYLGVGSVVSGDAERLSSLGIAGAMVALLGVCLSLVVVLIAPLLMFFRGWGLVAAVQGSFRLLRQRSGFVLRLVLMTLSFVFFFILLGTIMGQIPVIGMTMSYLFQSLGQTVALIYSFVILGEAESARGVRIGEDQGGQGQV
jgi:hypothetical protein